VSKAPRGRLAVVLVHYRTPELLGPACEALVRDAGDAGLDLEGVVVDNGSRPDDRALFDALPFPRLDPGRNLGYAGGVNLGVRHTTAEVVVAMNPDVVVLPGCLPVLVEALAGGAGHFYGGGAGHLDAGDAAGGAGHLDAAGPRFFWDRDRRYLLPPTEPVSRRWELLRLFARLGGRRAVRARAAWRRHARRHWLAEEPLPSFDLSGALLAFRRDAWKRIGPFDEGYRLYFEETDWLHRLRAAGGRAHHLPAAAAVHLYAQSTAAEGRATEWFLESSRRFRRRVHGRPFTALLELLDRLLPTVTPLELPDHPTPAIENATWLEISPAPQGFPAATRRLDRPAGVDLALPPEVWQTLAPGRYQLRAVDDDGAELSAWGVVKGTG